MRSMTDIDVPIHIIYIYIYIYIYMKNMCIHSYISEIDFFI